VQPPLSSRLSMLVISAKTHRIYRWETCLAIVSMAESNADGLVKEEDVCLHWST
jgi:hypothetical protein